MSINDPILEVLSFSLENDLALVSPKPQQPSFSSPSQNTPLARLERAVTGPKDADSGFTESFTPSSVLLEEDQKTLCPISECEYFCDKNICRDANAQQEVLAHLLKEHQLVIENPKEIANLSKYLEYWRKKLRSAPLTEFCVGFTMNTVENPSETNSSKLEGSKVSGESAEAKTDRDRSAQGSDGALYYMLSPDLPEDLQLRKQLWKRRLDIVLDVNRQEREETTFCRRCLFCWEVVGENRSKYFLHMRESHNFHIGQPDNLVFVRELLKLIEDKLNRLECLFCEHIYKDKLVLKEHMRKKQHRKINPHNLEYDQFYVVNYLEPGKTWENIGLEDTEGENREEEWVELAEEKQRNVVCLFCSAADCNFDNILDHMKTEHHFDFLQITVSLDFYEKVKLVNYIRRTVYQMSCLSCDERFQERELLLKHVSEHNINGSAELMPTVEKWNQAEYFFPTYENDDFLTFLDDDKQNADGSSGSDVGSNVIPEDLPPMATTSRDFDLAGFAIRYHNESNASK
ncbi:putative zinc finger protein [Orchesella cincta]|uniref:Putative zinc finger protein n=1 Tax=Orchesella cincta TaxID=48709 RepID=A0A1D2NBR2_ORCCI|nr:putative zinc finger protein [Orchesella cincta]